MRGHGCKLPRLLVGAVEAYLEEPTCIGAAARAGIARSTLYVWLRRPEFQQLCRQRRQARLREGIRLFQAQEAAQKPPSAHGCDGGTIRSGLNRAAA
jgi:hypothetical protein